MKKIVQIMFAGMLLVAFASCEKEEALERVDQTVETYDNSSNDAPVSKKSLKGESTGNGTDSGGPSITDPGNDDDYDKEDPATTNSSSSN